MVKKRILCDHCRGTGAASSETAKASALGAANAGLVPAGSGALSSAQLSAGATVFASVLAAAAALAI